MSEFTPGPWKARRVNRWFEVEDCQEREVASVWKDDRIKDAEAMANSNLISAAPDMYEALKECMVLFALGANAISRKGINFDEKRGKAREIERKVINALAKAKGESHD